MRGLTELEESKRNHLKAGLERFLSERMPLLADFAERLELPNPPMIVADPERFLRPIDAFMSHQIIDPDDRVWILTRIGYFIGELLIQRLGGCWFLNEIPDSRHFLKYVVGQFTSIRNQSAMIDPFQVADTYLSELPNKSLLNMVGQVEDELRSI